MFTVMVFLPLLGALTAGLCHCYKSIVFSRFITCFCVGIAAVLSVFVLDKVVFSEASQVIEIAPWISIGSFKVAWSLNFDALSVVMAFIIIWISFLVHVFSIGFIEKSSVVPSFMGYLSLFTFFMLVLVLSDNLIQLFFALECACLVSYFLIRWGNDREAIESAALKSFIVNCIGDIALIIGIFAVYNLFGSFNFAEILQNAPKHEGNAITAICLLFLACAMVKTAQIGLHTWLVDAMEAETPVSVLVHSTAIAGAGIFLIARMFPLFELSQTALTVMIVIGGTTAFFAAVAACVQTDIKRVMAFSNSSQFGLIFVAFGVGGVHMAVFYFVIHSILKSLMFLGVGSAIHALSNELDLRKMGGICRQVKFTCVFMWFGTLTMAGFPFLSGYYSIGSVMEAVYNYKGWEGTYSFILVISTVFLTAFYLGRLMFMLFHGEQHGDEKVIAHVAESPFAVIFPLLFLAVGSVFSICFIHKYFMVDKCTVTLSLLASLFGFSIAYVLYLKKPHLPEAISSKFKNTHSFLLNGLYFDKLYEYVLIRPVYAFGNILWNKAEAFLSKDSCVCRMFMVASHNIRQMHSGLVYHYALAMIVGITAFILWYIAVEVWL